MYESLNKLYELVNGIPGYIIGKEKEKSKIFIHEIYNETKEVYNNFNTILNHAYTKIESGEMSIDEAVRYFNDERLPFQSSRARIRGFIKHPYYQKNADLSWFRIGIQGVLCGGLHDVMKRFLSCEVRENDIGADTVVQFKSHHTIVDIINIYDRNNMNSLFYSDVYRHYIGDRFIEDEIKERLLRDIRTQIRHIEESWQLVCDHYPKLIG